MSSGRSLNLPGLSSLLCTMKIISAHLLGFTQGWKRGVPCALPMSIISVYFPHSSWKAQVQLTDGPWYTGLSRWLSEGPQPAFTHRSLLSSTMPSTELHL